MPWTPWDRGALCAPLVARPSLVTLRIDRGYFGYAQCTCTAGVRRISDSDGFSCLSCPIGCTCSEAGISGCFASPATGGLQSASMCAPIAPHGVTACVSVNVSTDTATETTLCAAGYTDRLCARCDSGYFAAGRVCVSCGIATTVIVAVLWALVLALAVLFVLKVCLCV